MKAENIDEIIDEQEIIDVDDNEEILPLDNYNIIKSGSLVDDIKNIEITIDEVPDIELQEIHIRETGNFLNLRENIINIPIEMIVFPFFTPQKQNKRVNFKYYFEDMGVTMFSTLVIKNKFDKVFQPSIFEEKIYTYLISMYEIKKEMNEEDESDYIEFEISDFIVNFLGNKMNRAYYTKVEQALKNLKNTQYQFVVSNHTKLGKYKFEDEEFKLLTYQKLKKGKKIYYRVTLNKNIRKKIKDKRYIKYNSKNLLEILTKDPIAARIYKYISKLRYEKFEGTINIRTLAAIIPLKIEQITERQTKSGSKTYILNRVKQVLSRILKGFESLVELGYILEYKERFVPEEDIYYIDYVFNQEKDGECHISSFMLINKNKKQKTKPKKLEKLDADKAEIVVKAEKNQEIVELDLEYVGLPKSVVSAIKKAKRNTNVSKAWNKRMDNKIHKIFRDEGEEFTKDILRKLGVNLKGPIQTTLVQYINGVIKNTKSLKEKNKNLSLFTNVKGLKSKKLINQARKIAVRNSPIQKVEFDSVPLLSLSEDKEINKKDTGLDIEIKEKFNALDKMTKIEIENKALKIFEKESKESKTFVLKIKATSPGIYFRILGPYLKRVLEEENK